ncbi:probable cytochrome P450 6a14 isoform X1 [Leptinotarsa decemlineata]|uniref:probable cytochrome P450 6a14 isoform X1 n=1 Tax=Leptinotarsa decemlineata TaxID=7539 RepID=UPI003D308206
MWILVPILITISASFYLYSKWKFSYWRRKGFAYIEPEFIFGNTKQFFRNQVSYGALFDEFYRKFKSMGLKYGGVYNFFKPILIVTDLNLIKDLLQKDFEYFPNRGFYVDEENDPLAGNLFCLEDEKWKALRVKLNPTFSSGKVKMMHQIILECTTDLLDMLQTNSAQGNPVNVREAMMCFTTNVIGSVAFGIKCNTFKDPNSEFAKFSQTMIKLNFRNILKMFIIPEYVPKWFLKKVGFRVIPKSLENFYKNLVTSTIDYREKNNIHRNDFLHFLLQLKNLGKVTDDGTLCKDPSAKSLLTVNEIVAQCYIFFLAGSETSATTISSALLELAVNHDIQEKARHEIREVLKKHNGEVTYEALGDMTYLDLIMMETLRKHSPAAKLLRKCGKPYTIPGSNCVIEAGTSLIIPVYSIQRDPDIYPDPEQFDPERFTSENKSKRHPCSFLSFGDGPRYCIGIRMGKLQIKIGLAEILKNFKVFLNERTSYPIEYESTLVSSVPKGGIWLNLEKVEKY